MTKLISSEFLNVDLLSSDHHRRLRLRMKQEMRQIPKGYLAIKVGAGGGDHQQRFVVPLLYFNHPLFLQLLKEAEDEYGFEQKGTIALPCHVEKFRYVQFLIDRDQYLHDSHTQQGGYCFWV